MVRHYSCNPLSNLNAGSEDIQLYTEGDKLFDAMILAIERAQEQIWMETYIFADDEVGHLFAKVLSKKARSGVQVRLMVDALGSLFQFYRSLGSELENAGVTVCHFQPWHWREPLRYNRRDHRKLLVVDGKQAFLGGFNIHRESSLRYFGIARWRDTHTSFQGDLAKQAAELFDELWRGERYQLPKTNKYAINVLISNQTRLCRRRLACIYNDLLGNAQQQICLTTPYFVPDHRIQNTLLSAVKRGVNVHLLVPRTSDVRLVNWAANAVYARLLDGGVRIFEYLPRMLHAKVLIVDRQCAMLGTANLDYRSLFQNYELNLVSRDLGLCNRLQKQFEDDLTESVAVCATHWQQRHWVHKVAEVLGWMVRRWL